MNAESQERVKDACHYHITGIREYNTPESKLFNFFSGFARVPDLYAELLNMILRDAERMSGDSSNSLLALSPSPDTDLQKARPWNYGVLGTVSFLA